MAEAHGQTDPHRTGNRPKALVEKTVLGLPVGRDKTVVPPDQVYELAAIGCNDGEIARFFGIKEDTLRYNFAAQLTKAREYVKIRLRRNMFKAADNLQPAVMIFLAKNMLNMSDNGSTSVDDTLPWVETDPNQVNETEEANETQ